MILEQGTGRDGNGNACLLPSVANRIQIDGGHFWVHLNADYAKPIENSPPIALNTLQNIFIPTEENESP
jgi:hypothetical protein